MRELLSDAFPASAWRWGDDYLLEPGRRRLTRRGEPVEVDDRAFDLIVLLLQHRERALDKAEVITAIWGKRPVSDATLRQLVYKARRAVGDDGERQAVISTLYGRSLQWIAAVEMVLETGSPELRPVSAASNTTSTDPERASTSPASTVAERRHMRIVGLAVLALLVVVATAGVWFAATRSPAPGVAGAQTLPRIAIAPIENATGEKSLDWVHNGLPGLLGSLLDRAGDVDMVDSAQVAKTWKFRPTQGRDQEQQVRFVTNANVVIGGRLRKLANKLYELDLHMQSGAGEASDVVMSGEHPGLLAVAAVRRIRADLSLTEPALPVGRLPRDAFLAEAYARGVDLQVRGKLGDSSNYFKLCTAQAHDFLPCRYRLGLSQLEMGDSAAGIATMQTLLPLAKKQNDSRLVAYTLLRLANHARVASGSADALDYLYRALPYAQRAGDPETVAEIHLLTAIAANNAHDTRVSADAMTAAEVLLKQHPDMRYAQELLYQARGTIAQYSGKPEDAIAPARAALAMEVEDGNESFAVSAMGNLAAALQAAHRTGEAITVNARALQRARVEHFEMDEALDAGNLALELISVGLPEVATAFGNRQYALSGRQHNVQTQAIAVLINMTADLQLLDGAKALARLKQVDDLEWDSLDPEILLDRWLYEAMAAYLADPGALPALRQRVDAWRASHKLAADLVSRVHLVHALVASAAGREVEAMTALKAAVTAGHLDSDGDLEVRMAPLLVAVHAHDANAAAIALKNYHSATTRDASLLPLYAKWMRQSGDAASAAQAEMRLAELRKIGTDAVRDAGLDLAHLDGQVLSSAAGDNQ